MTDKYTYEIKQDYSGPYFCIKEDQNFWGWGRDVDLESTCKMIIDTANRAYKEGIINCHKNMDDLIDELGKENQGLKLKLESLNFYVYEQIEKENKNLKEELVSLEEEKESWISEVVLEREIQRKMLEDYNDACDHARDLIKEIADEESSYKQKEIQFLTEIQFLKDENERLLKITHQKSYVDSRCFVGKDPSESLFEEINALTEENKRIKEEHENLIKEIAELASLYQDLGAHAASSISDCAVPSNEGAS